MPKYVKYSDFVAYYPAHDNNAGEEMFEAYAASAEAYIDVITHNRAATVTAATDYKMDRVKRAVCALIIEMHAADGARGANGSRITQATNDGYTEVYAGAVSASGEADTFRSIALRWLSGTGLVSAL